MKTAQETVIVPKKSLTNLLEAARNFAAFQNEIEDFLLVNDKGFIKKMRQAKKSFPKGGISWEVLRRRHV